MPLYPLYALLFADAGLSDARISVLFAIWSTVGIVAEVPCGALADRFSRRGSLAVAGVLQAGGYAWWMASPDFTGYAIGFVLWGLGGSLASGATEALLYDGLAAAGAADRFTLVFGRVTAAGLVAQVPAALSAALLYRLGGYPAAGWASVVACLAAAVLATRLPDARPAEAAAPGAPADGGSGYLATLRDGLRQAATHRAVRGMLVVVAVLAGVDAIEEYLPLLIHEWGVPTGLNPLVSLGIPLAGAAGAALAGRAGARSSRAMAVLVGASAAILAAAGVLHHPAAVLLLVAFYGLYRLALVLAEARLQDRIGSSARATVTSVAGLGSEFAALGLYAGWAAGGALLVAALLALVAVALPRVSHDVKRRYDPPGPPPGSANRVD